MKCENCFRKVTCGRYPIDKGLPPKGVQAILKNNEDCPHFSDIDKIIELPCKVGDVVWTKTGYFSRTVKQEKVINIILWSSNSVNNDFSIITSTGKYLYNRSFWLNKEDAEKALREIKKNEN